MQTREVIIVKENTQRQANINKRTRYPDCVSDIGALGGLHLQRFPNSAEFGHNESSPDRSQGKSPSRLGLDQVQRLGPPTTPHDIIHYALSERE
ncbi:hypothetical protein DEO72_LG9g182 [Vigna unguiculata]|uniref:Uncharacterized protein n=1 Tax=Vigna unguiculata TaxID=3917 RepID=A0A4D6MWY9_VIGUN|nr:hypothetical protein DEO72_LG9g182 [Vigna unguiculata]